MLFCLVLEDDNQGRKKQGDSIPGEVDEREAFRGAEYGESEIGCNERNYDVVEWVGILIVFECVVFEECNAAVIFYPLAFGKDFCGKDDSRYADDTGCQFSEP